MSLYRDYIHRIWNDVWRERGEMSGAKDLGRQKDVSCGWGKRNVKAAGRELARKQTTNHDQHYCFHSLSHAYTWPRAGRGNLQEMKGSRHTRAELTFANQLKQVAAKGMARSTITIEAAIRESLGRAQIRYPHYYQWCSDSLWPHHPLRISF